MGNDTNKVTGIIAKTFWFSYILFLIFLGGILVLFIYTTSLASNEIFSFSTKLFLNIILYLLIRIFIIFLIDKTYIYNIFINTEIININDLISFLPENTTSLYKLYNYPTNFTTILIVNYLLITIIAIVKITNSFFGTLRIIN